MPDLREIADEHGLTWSPALEAALENAFRAGAESAGPAPKRRGPPRYHERPGAAEVIRRIHTRRAEGASYARIAGELNLDRIRTVRGLEWTRGIVQAIATRYPSP